MPLSLRRITSLDNSFVCPWKRKGSQKQGLHHFPKQHIPVLLHATYTFLPYYLTWVFFAAVEINFSSHCNRTSAYFQGLLRVLLGKLWMGQFCADNLRNWLSLPLNRTAGFLRHVLLFQQAPALENSNTTPFTYWCNMHIFHMYLSLGEKEKGRLNSKGSD